MTGKKQEDAEKSATSRTGETRKSGDTKRAKARRLVLKSIVTGGAVTTARSLPDKWVRPITESVLLPAHAQVSQVALACRVEDISADYSFGDTSPDANAQPDDLVYSPPGSAPYPVSGGGPLITVDRFFVNPGDAGNVGVQLNSVRATLDPAAAGDVTLTLVQGGDFTLVSPASSDVTPNGSGVASFGTISGDLARSNSPGTSTGNLDLRFSAPGASDCVISFSFQESAFGPL